MTPHNAVEGAPMWEIELGCEPVGPLVPAVGRTLEDAFVGAGVEARWGRRALRLRFALRPGECMEALGSLSAWLAANGLPVRLYQINAARSPAATQRLVG